MIINLIKLLLFWIILIGDIDAIMHAPILHLGSLLFIYIIMWKLKFAPISMRRYVESIRYGIWLLREIVMSALEVTKYVYGSAQYTYYPQVKWIKSKQKSDFNLSLYASSITLTPGTFTVDVEGQNLLIHSLDYSGISDLRKGKMDAMVSKV